MRLKLYVSISEFKQNKVGTKSRRNLSRNVAEQQLKTKRCFKIIWFNRRYIWPWSNTVGPLP